MSASLLLCFSPATSTSSPRHLLVSLGSSGSSWRCRPPAALSGPSPSARPRSPWRRLLRSRLPWGPLRVTARPFQGPRAQGLVGRHPLGGQGPSHHWLVWPRRFSKQCSVGLRRDGGPSSDFRLSEAARGLGRRPPRGEERVWGGESGRWVAGPLVRRLSGPQLQVRRPRPLGESVSPSSFL